MNILIACDSEGNEIIPLERYALAQSDTVQQVFCGREYFWRGSLQVDIVHLHWPESLFSWREPDENELKDLAERLKYWRRKAKIVVTSHNVFPHYRDTEMFRRLYRLVYCHADAVIHMGKASHDDFMSRYPEINDIGHVIIPHGIYAGFDKSAGKEQSRQRLGIELGEVVFLAFGAIRDAEELKLLLNAFNATAVTRKRLLIAGGLKISRRSIKGIAYRAKLYLQKNVTWAPGFIPKTEVHHYFNASDAVVIPRINILNSGNVILGFTFGRCVIGPNTGVVGEILEETGNILYSVGDFRSLAKAMEGASHIDLNHQGSHNREYALRYWNWDVVGSLHLDLFHKLSASPCVPNVQKGVKSL